MHDWKSFVILLRASKIYVSENYNLHIAFYIISLLKGVGMIRAEIGLKNRQIINETYSFRCFLIL
jgi:hypothetical protein